MSTLAAPGIRAMVKPVNVGFDQFSTVSRGSSRSSSRGTLSRRVAQAFEEGSARPSGHVILDSAEKRFDVSCPRRTERRDPSASPPARVRVMGRQGRGVDDDRELRGILGSRLAQAGYEVKEAPNGLGLVSTSIRPARHHRARRDDVVDRRLRAVPRHQVEPGVRHHPRRLHVRPQPRRATSARHGRGAVDYFPKPLDIEKLSAASGRLIPIH